MFPPQLCKTEPTFTKDIETFLASLTSPLQIVHTVDPAEVALHPIPWIPSIKKELGAVEHAVLRLPPSDPKQAEYLKNPRLQVVPSKFVFTVKPPEQGAAVVGEVAAAASQKEGLYRRKARIVAMRGRCFFLLLKFNFHLHLFLLLSTARYGISARRAPDLTWCLGGLYIAK